MDMNNKLRIAALVIFFGHWAAACGGAGGRGGGGGDPLGGAGGSGGGGSAEGGGSSSAGGAGDGFPCAVAADCPPAASECSITACKGGACVTGPAPDGALTAAQASGDCRTNTCQGGVVVSMADDADPPDDANDCTINTCQDGSPAVAVAAFGSPCAQGGGKVCDGDACVECVDDGQCPGAICALNKCVQDPCTNGLLDGSETDVDCGGSCAAKCGPGEACAGDVDCAGSACSSGSCAPTCTDLVADGGETDVDCGGPCPSPCGPGKSCAANADCAGSLCDASTLTCISTCSDGFSGGDETDVDCGGATCPACPVGAACSADSDCTSTVCDLGSCALLNGCDPAAAADLTGQDPVTVTFDSSFYDPPCVRVSPGTKVVFSGSFATHPLAGGKSVGGAKLPDVNSPFMPITDSGMNKTFTLLSAGSFPFYCDADATMFGAVFVE